MRSYGLVSWRSPLDPWCIVAASFAPTMQNVARTCQTRVTRGAKLEGGFVDGFLLLLFILNEYFFPEDFSETFNYFFFSFWSMASGECLECGKKSDGWWLLLGGVFQGTREKRV